MVTVELPVNPIWSTPEEAEVARAGVSGTPRELSVIALRLDRDGLSAHGRIVADLALRSYGGRCAGTVPLHVGYNVWAVARLLGYGDPEDERRPL